MKLIKSKSPLEAALVAKDGFVLRNLEVAHTQAATLKEANAWFWSQPDDVLLGMLNDDVPYTLDTFNKNTAMGLAVNAILDTENLPQFPSRAPVTIPRKDITFDEKRMCFVLTPSESKDVTEIPNRPVA